MSTPRSRSLQFYDVVPLDDLLARLELEGERISFKLVALLESSYFPSGGDDASRVQRCVTTCAKSRCFCLPGPFPLILQ